MMFDMIEFHPKHIWHINTWRKEARKKRKGRDFNACATPSNNNIGTFFITQKINKITLSLKT